VINFNKSGKVVKVFSITGKYLRLSRNNQNNINILKSHWAQNIMKHFNVEVKVIGKPAEENESFILVGNHISYLDIPLMFYTCPEISFVSKKEIKSWPVIGRAAEKIQTIFVDRDKSQSRAEAKNQIAKSLLDSAKKLVIFPSSTTTLKESRSWKHGAFEIAQKNKIKVQPFRIRYEPLRPAAYIDHDNFLIHMYKIFSFSKIEATVEFHEPVFISDITSDCATWKKWCEE